MSDVNNLLGSEPMELVSREAEGAIELTAEGEDPDGRA